METTMKYSHALAALTVAASITAAAAPAMANDFVCRAPLGAVVVDNVVVPPNATCVMTGTRATGSVRAEVGATLVANRVIIIGDVQSDSAKRVTVRRQSTIGGSIQVQQGGGATILDSSVTGTVEVQDVVGSTRVANTAIGGDLKYNANRGTGTLSLNRINGNMQCQGNFPAPTGSGNLVGGVKEDQCRGL
jgi:hypothetical protein